MFLFLLITAVFIILVHDQLLLLDLNHAGFNIVSLSFSSSVGADHFFLDALLEGLVKFLSMLIAVLVNFLGQLVEELVEAIFGPSTWQVACACIVDHLVIGLVGCLGEPWRLARTMLLVSCWSVQ